MDQTPKEANRWTNCCFGTPESGSGNSGDFLVGAIDGEGIGEEVVGAALEVLNAISEASNNVSFTVAKGGPIGRDGEKECGMTLPPGTAAFFEETFQQGGAILCGPGGGRFVYDLRKEFDLFFKISPIQIQNGLIESARLKPEFLQAVDLLVVRENCGGIYQGEWSDKSGSSHHAFEYSATEVKRFLQPAAQLAVSRSGKLTVVFKESGVPGISQLWKQCMEDIAAEQTVEFEMVDVDLMAYRLIHEPAGFDVIAAPNLFGDVLADLAAVLLGSRGLSYSGNYDGGNRAVYQTNHGAAYDLAGKNLANPVGQILSAAMMLRESFGLHHEASAVCRAVRQVWNRGWRTADGLVPGRELVSTADLSKAIAEETFHLVAGSPADATVAK